MDGKDPMTDVLIRRRFGDRPTGRNPGDNWRQRWAERGPEGFPEGLAHLCHANEEMKAGYRRKHMRGTQAGAPKVHWQGCG